MASPTRNFKRPSGAWGRLKSISTDPLDAVGLPSKGDTKLLDPKAQEMYFTNIVARYTKFCGRAGTSENLDKAFALLSLNESAPKGSGPGAGSGTTTPSNASPADKNVSPTSARSGTNTTPSPPKKKNNNNNNNDPEVLNKELSVILMALRKLREALVATSRIDAFAQHAYLFSIRASILVQHYESYQPALLHLLHRIHLLHPLPPPDLHECVGYLVLDLACRQQNIGAAYAAKIQYKYSDRRVELILKALAHENWYAFWRLRQAVNGYQTRLLQPAEQELRLHALKCLGRTYFTVEKPYLERSTDMSWEELTRGGLQVGWVLEGDKVVIRRPKAR
ncbi:hypothetical protein L228DRAFT_271112 [Xylona heveae TC161]|uniref:CSN8/PSMD8/EIF3K domain-containing protein n=1 Tax=Xylona heveae (strain CBS 132557 / TC161) TaxID=1328760 RepID=A0A165A0T2_XYLHT|nr:hypothetical protein L228DRAFT_271112 [Xylona heveae TC161]KZF19793.1 hypothetical protein L228DRAFT_271112 [Xylona heveae TC161]